MSGGLDIHAAGDTRQRRRFLELPYQLYRGEPNWIPPLRGVQAKLLACGTAFFRHAEMGLFLAERAGRAVGRIAAIHNRAHNAHHGDRVGFFGFFECADRDTEATAGLVEAAEGWLAQRGLEVIRGPVSPSMGDECGLLIEGFQWPPMVMMPYNPPGYAELLEAAGFRKCKDLHAHRVELEDVRAGSASDQRMTRLVEAIAHRHPELMVRSIDMARYRQEVGTFMAVFEEARRNNWGYVPITPEELAEKAGMMRTLIDPRIVLLAEVRGEPAGASLALPDANQALRGLDGRLLPLGFLRLLWRLRRVRQMRVLGIAALEKYRHMGIAALLMAETIRRGMPLGYNVAEASWVLEDNELSARTIQQGTGARHYKTYRLYEKPIGGSG